MRFSPGSCFFNNVDKKNKTCKKCSNKLMWLAGERLILPFQTNLFPSWVLNNSYSFFYCTSILPFPSGLSTSCSRCVRRQRTISATSVRESMFCWPRKEAHGLPSEENEQHAKCKERPCLGTMKPQFPNTVTIWGTGDRTSMCLLHFSAPSNPCSPVVISSWATF